MAHIEKCVRDLVTKGGKKAAIEHAAVWVPDSEAPVCMVCKKSQFTLVNRRVRAESLLPFCYEITVIVLNSGKLSH